MKDKSKFKELKPKEPHEPEYPSEPVKKQLEPKFGFWDLIFSSSKQKKIEASNNLFKDAFYRWKVTTAKLEGKYEKEIEAYEESLDAKFTFNIKTGS